MDLGPGLFCKYSNTVNLTLKSMGQINCGMFTNGKNVRNIQSSFSPKTRSFPGKSFSCHKSRGAKWSAYLQHEK